eukprot:7127098-Prymnesium_polylepis.1
MISVASSRSPMLMCRHDAPMDTCTRTRRSRARSPCTPTGSPVLQPRLCAVLPAVLQQQSRSTRVRARSRIHARHDARRTVRTARHRSAAAA